MKCKVNGVKYKSKPEGQVCEGCAAHDPGAPNTLCGALPDCTDIIWVKKKPKVTCEVGGVVYKAKANPDPNTPCTGCVAYLGKDEGFNETLCHALGTCNGVHWVEVKPKKVIPIVPIVTPKFVVEFKHAAEKVQKSCTGCVAYSNSHLCKVIRDGCVGHIWAVK